MHNAIFCLPLKLNLLLNHQVTLSCMLETQSWTKYSKTKHELAQKCKIWLLSLNAIIWAAALHTILCVHKLAFYKKAANSVFTQSWYVAYYEHMTVLVQLNNDRNSMGAWELGVTETTVLHWMKRGQVVRAITAVKMLTTSQLQVIHDFWPLKQGHKEMTHSNTLHWVLVLFKQ